MCLDFDYMLEIKQKAEARLKNCEPLDRVFDWQKAAEMIKERKPKEAVAFLKEQRRMTGGVIWRKGKPVYNENTYLLSDWDIPMIDMDGQIEECWRVHDITTVPDEMGHRWYPEEQHVAYTKNYWNAFTKWPDSALDILGVKRR